MQERYPDFPPKLAREQLVELDGYRVNLETPRQWMTQERLWKPENTLTRRRVGACSVHAVWSSDRRHIAA